MKKRCAQKLPATRTSSRPKIVGSSHSAAWMGFQLAIVATSPV